MDEPLSLSRYMCPPVCLCITKCSKLSRRPIYFFDTFCKFSSRWVLISFLSLSCLFLVCHFDHNLTKFLSPLSICHLFLANTVQILAMLVHASVTCSWFCWRHKTSVHWSPLPIVSLPPSYTQLIVICWEPRPPAAHEFQPAFTVVLYATFLDTQGT